MYNQKVIAHNLKATREQIIDDLNGVMSSLQRRMMKELLIHLDELNIHIRNLDDEIDNFMKPEEKQASQAIQDVTGIGNTSAQAIISVIGTDMERFPTDKHISSWAGLCPETMKAPKEKIWKDQKRELSTTDNIDHLCACSCKKQEVLLPCSVYADKRPPRDKACLCGRCPFHAHCDIPHPQGWCCFQGSGS